MTAPVARDGLGREPTSDPGPDVGDDGTSPPRADQRGLARSASAMTVLTAVSRATGFLRIAVVTNVLGISYLANTYETANTIPNILFELLAAGALQAVLIPAMVQLVDSADPDESEHVAGAVLGLSCAVMAAVAAAGLVAAPTIMRLLVHRVSSPQVRASEVALGRFFLWFFLPQIVLYAANVVATAILNARDRFVVPVFAPTVNNVVVIATYLTFAAMRHGRAPSLDLTTAEQMVLAGGTTLAVLAFCSVTVVAAGRNGFRWRPNFDHRHPVVRRLARDSGWAALFLACSQVLLVVILQLVNGREGGVAVYNLAWTVYLLPHALFSVPVLTTRFPTLSRQVLADRWDRFADTLVRGTRSITFLTLLPTSLLIALSLPATRVIVHGRNVVRLPEIAEAVAGFAPGIIGFGLMLYFTRACYATRDARTPTLVNMAITAMGAAGMVIAAHLVAGRHLVAALGLVYAASQTLGAVTLAVVLRRRVHGHGARGPGYAVPALRALVGSVAAGVLAWLAARPIGHVGTWTSLAGVVVGGVVGVVVYLGVTTLLGGPMPLEALRTLGATERHDVAPGEAVDDVV